MSLAFLPVKSTKNPEKSELEIMCSCPMKIHIETADENPPVIATNIIHLAEFQSQPRIKMKPNIISYTQISSACNVLTLNLKVLFLGFTTGNTPSSPGNRSPLSHMFKAQSQYI